MTQITGGSLYWFRAPHFFSDIPNQMTWLECGTSLYLENPDVRVKFEKEGKDWGKPNGERGHPTHSLRCIFLANWGIHETHPFRLQPFILFPSFISAIHEGCYWGIYLPHDTEFPSSSNEHKARQSILVHSPRPSRKVKNIWLKCLPNTSYPTEKYNGIVFKVIVTHKHSRVSKQFIYGLSTWLRVYAKS